LTQIPDPRKNCIVPRSILEIRVHRCGGNIKIKIDCIFSGHALIIFVLTKSIIESKFKGGLFQIMMISIMFTMSSMSLIALVSSRAHYSVDIILSIFIAHLNWDKNDIMAKLKALSE
jgi:hypothetical protein